MARGRIEWAERMVGLWNAGDLDAFLDEIGPEFQFTPDPTFPDTGVYEGDALREWMREWARIWENNRFEILDFSEDGDAALIRSRWHLGAPRSGEEVPVQDFTVVLWWEGPEAARPSRMAAFFDHEQALRAAAGGTG